MILNIPDVLQGLELQIDGAQRARRKLAEYPSILQIAWRQAFVDDRLAKVMGQQLMAGVSIDKSIRLIKPVITHRQLLDTTLRWLESRQSSTCKFMPDGENYKLIAHTVFRRHSSFFWKLPTNSPFDFWPP
jgi:hypothetical protein